MKPYWLSLLIASVIMSGCAVSGVSRYNQLLLHRVAVENWSSNFGVHTNCPAEMKSVAVAPVIPLPPLVPVGFLNEDVSIVVVQTPRDFEVKIGILDSVGEKVELPIEVDIFDGNQFGKTEIVTWTHEVGSSCENLNDKRLIVEIQDSSGKKSEVKFSLEFIRGELKSEAGYISA